MVRTRHHRNVESLPSKYSSGANQLDVRSTQPGGRLASKTWERARTHGVDWRATSDDLGAPGANKRRYMSSGKGASEHIEGGGRQQNVTNMVGSDDQNPRIGPGPFQEPWTDSSPQGAQDAESKTGATATHGAHSADTRPRGDTSDHSARGFIHHDKCEVALGRNLIIDSRAHVAFANRAALRNDIELESEGISRQYLAAEFQIVDPGKQRQFALISLIREQQDYARLGKRLDDQYARHDWIAREMPRKEGLVTSHALDRHDPLTKLELEHSVNQEHGIPMRNDALDIGGFEHEASIAGQFAVDS
jgi:hypothetical protein